jgi:hypothetical protein
MKLLAGLVAAALAAAPALPPAPVLPAAEVTPSTMELIAPNWGGAVSLTDPEHPAYAHLSARSGPTAVAVLLHFTAPASRGFTATLVDPQAVDGEQPEPCVANSAGEVALCTFEVAVGAGVNQLEVTLILPGAPRPFTRHGWITGGVFQFTAGLQATDAAGIWRPIPAGGDIRLPATLFTRVRYVVGNVGGIPIRVEGACREREIAPGSSLACPLADARPAVSLAGPFYRRLLLTDPTGAVGGTSVDGVVRAIPAEFRLEGTSAVVGQSVEVAVSGLHERDLGLLALQVGSRPVRLGPDSTTRRLTFAMPFVEAGATTVDVALGGVTVARMPVRVSATEQPASRTAFPIVLAIIVGIGAALLALLLWRAVASLRPAIRRSP